MSFLVYKVVHILGLAFLFVALGALIGVGSTSPQWRRLSMVHGIALLLLLVSGFGMLAQLGGGFPPWMLVKLLLWLFMGVVVVLIRRGVGPQWAWWLSLPVLGTVAGYLALYKPF